MHAAENGRNHEATKGLLCILPSTFASLR